MLSKWAFDPIRVKGALMEHRISTYNHPHRWCFHESAQLIMDTLRQSNMAMEFPLVSRYIPSHKPPEIVQRILS